MIFKKNYVFIPKDPAFSAAKYRFITSSGMLTLIQGRDVECQHSLRSGWEQGDGRRQSYHNTATNRIYKG